MRSLACLFVASAAVAAPMRPEDVPAPLRPWIPWAMHDQGRLRCPFLTGLGDTPCAWPAAVELRLSDRQGESAQQWRIYDEEWVPLPGNAELWPQDVTVDGRPAPVVATDEQAGVVLAPGDHTVRARFAWDTLPESIRLPVPTGLVRLFVRGQAVPFPLREDDRLWIQRARPAETEEDRLDVRVHRLIIDGVPLVVRTQMQLRVSGKDRELLLGRALLPGAIPMALSGDVPARLEADGRVRVQVTAGEHAVELVSRQEGPVASLTRAAPDGPWAVQEIWAFQAMSHFRVVGLEGIPPVDPKQTTLPAEWQQLPAFVVDVGETLRLVEKRRGDADPPPDRLTLERALWLDHDGGGLTARDQISGSLRRSFRLEMGAGTDLGRAAIDGQDQLITRLRKGGAAGIEVRQGVANVESVARIRDRFAVPAVSWNHDFHAVNAVLHVPPGWRLFAAWGADDVPETWLRRWSLLDLFLVLVVAFASGRLWGARWGVVALLAVGLSATESDAPRWAWVAALCAEALVRVLPRGRIVVLARAGRLGAQVVLVLLTVPFVVQHLRVALYPAIERDTTSAATWDMAQKDAGMPARPAPVAVPEAPPAAVPPMAAQAEGSAGQEVADLLQGVASNEERKAMRLNLRSAPEPSYAADVDPNAQVQTGPGLPRWSWDTATLRFSGPVDRGQTIRLLLAPPWLNLLLGVLRVALLALMIGRLLGRLIPRPPSATATAAALALLCLTPGLARAEIPPPEMIEQLRGRLTERPACAPNCVSLPRMMLDATSATLRLRLELDAAARTAVPLPGSDEWPPDRVLLDGAPARPLMRHDGALWIAVEPGRHQVLLEGALPPRSSVQIRFGLRPRRVEVHAAGWTVAGVHADGVADAALVLSREQDEARPADGALEPGALPPFVSIDRTLHLGLVWQVDTTVRRLTPPGAAVVLKIPLLPGESVTTPATRVENRLVEINLAADEGERSWQSTLPVTEAVSLSAQRERAWTEVWRLDASAIWHVTPRGLPPVQPQDEAGRRVPEWRPWPGETLALEVTRPGAVAGRTLTVEHVGLALSPGERAVDASLSLEVRSSRGGEHTVTLPAGATLETVSIDGAPQPIRAQGRRVVLPIVPGQRRFDLVWRESRGIATRFVGSEVDLGAPATNADLSVAMPAGRWTLFVGGPRQGPAVLFWSLLAGLLLVAWGLSRSPLVSLRFHQWMLLAIGLSQVPIWAAAVVAGWLLALGARRRWPMARTLWFDLGQLVLLGWTVAAMVVLFVAIQQGLLGQPDMQIAGNGSGGGDLRWFADRTGASLPRPWALSVPLVVYRLAMLGWALWIARALIGWLRWAWQCFAEGGLWQPVLRRRSEPPSAPPAT